MTPEEVEKEFEGVWKEKTWASFELGRKLFDTDPRIIEMIKRISLFYWLKAHSRQEKRIERLKEGVKNIPWNEYGDALREGCDTNGAWNCFCDETNRHIQKLLEEKDE